MTERKTCPQCGRALQLPNWKYCDVKECRRARDVVKCQRYRDKMKYKRVTEVNNWVCPDCPEGFIYPPTAPMCGVCGAENKFVVISDEKDQEVDMEKLALQRRKRDKVCIKCEGVPYRNGKCEKCYKDEEKLVSLLKRQRHFIQTDRPL